MGIENPLTAPRVWEVGALCRAVADTLQARFNPVAVRGEITGFSRAASGHCYFALKDGQGQIRCAMFRRAAEALDFVPRDGELVEVQGRLGVYEARGDLQLVVEQLHRAGQGALFEQFLRLKARLDAEGLFDPSRKRALPTLPRGIGLVTSTGAAALHDVVTALRRRAPHLPVVLVPAQVQGAQAPASLCAAPTDSSYRTRQSGWYAQGVYQFMANWRIGLRYEQLASGTRDFGSNAANLVVDNYRPKKATAMVDYSWSEFSRMRLQYAQDQSMAGVTDHQWSLQYIMSLGAHGAHKF